MFSVKGLLATLLLQASLGLGSPITAVEKRASGFQNVVYFTNWLVYQLLYE